MIKALTNCRLCTGEFFEKTLKLKSTPPANELYPTQESAKEAEKFPLEVVMCQKCRHVQLKHIVSPKRLFDDYVYNQEDYLMTISINQGHQNFLMNISTS